MSVASGVEFGDACMAALGQLPQVIGNIQTAIGCGTIRRASGIAVQVMVGDPVCQGDVIETAADGRIEIRFVDGTVFNLSRDTRVELSEFARDSNGTLRSALFAVTRGTFAFIAGQLAKTGSLTVDTPVGSIRSRAQAGGIGMLSFAALIFSLMKEVQAADPNVTFLDDDTITYKDLEHGVFELITKEAIPRHIIVEDPGETVVLSRRGSSISVNEVANSLTRMQEFQTAQQDVLANLAKGLGPNGSSTPPFLNPQQLLQPINFIQTDAIHPQTPLPPLEWAVFTIREGFVVPTLKLGVGPTEIDTAVFDRFTATSGTFSASSANRATLTFGISGGVPDNTVLGGVTYNVSSTGSFGTLHVNSTTGAYTFVPNNNAINALKANTTQSFIITLSDGSLLLDQTFNITIIGADDAAVISGTTTGSVVGAVGVARASPGLLIATGTLTDTDVDDPANTFTPVSAPTKSAGGFGTFAMTATGVWTYTLDNANSAVQALHVGDTLTDTFTVTSIGGTPQVITITVHGPLIGTTGTAPSLTLSETHLTATALDDNIGGSAPDAASTTKSVNFSTAFTSAQGADGATISYALTITGGNGSASGLIDSHTGLPDVLVLEGNTIQGRVGTTGGSLAFTIAVDPTTGLVTFTEYRAVTQPLGTNPDGGEGLSLTTGIVNLDATVTETDGNFQTVSLDLASRLTITDDGPSITATGTAPSLTLSETHLTTTALGDYIAGSAPVKTSGNFSTAFTSVQGSDGATISYALTITGGNGSTSGLIDSHTGLADVLVLNGNTIEGRVGGTGGTLAFAITLDPTTGLVTFTDYRAVTQPSGTNPDGGEGVSLSAGIVNLVATITDTDGDFQIASLDLGKQLTITDAGPTIGGFEQATIAAQDNQIFNGTYNVNFGADGDAAMLVAVHNGAVGSTGYNLATSGLGGGITSVHVTGNGDDYTFYYTTHAVSGGVELDAYFTDTSGTLTDPYFTMLINPDGTYSFDLKSVELLKEVTVTGSDFGASGGGTPSLTAPDGQLVITGSDNSGLPLDVKASNNGIAVGDTGLQMDPSEDLQLAFSQEQSRVSFILTQWQGNGSANVIFKVLDGGAGIHDFNINIPKPPGGITNIVVQETSSSSLIDTYSFDRTTSTYTLYVGQTFNQIQVDYDQAEAGNATFTINNITYNEEPIIPSADLLFDVSAVDADGDSATASLQVDLQGNTTGAISLTSTATSDSTALIGSGGIDPTAIISSPTTGSAIETADATSGTPIATSTLTYTNVSNTPDAFTAVSSPTKSDHRYGTFPMTAATVWTCTPDNNGAANAVNVGDTLTDIIISGFGAILLIGGNGKDTFVNSSAADSNAAQLDTITDFVSGSDKIDLTAFGSLASVILALLPGSTSVPAHTIAYVSKPNETIVYVNPTDQALSIGDSGLHKIHLPGGASVHLSDFALAATSTVVVASDPNDLATLQSDATIVATAADVSSDATVHNSGLFADLNSTVQITSIGDSFDATRDHIDSIDYAKFAGFDESGSASSKYSVDDALITLPSGLSIELPQVAVTALMQTSFAFDQKPVFDSADLMTVDHGAVIHGPKLESGVWIVPSESDWKANSGTSLKNEDHEASIPKAAGPMNAGDAHAHEIGTGPNVVLDSGVLKTLESGSGNRSIASGAGEHATPPHGAGVHAFEPSSIPQVVSWGTTGTPGDSFHFKDEISSFKGSGVIDLALDQIPASMSHHEGAAGTHVLPTISDGAQAIGLPQPGQHPDDHFNIVPDHAPSAIVTHVPHDLIV